MGDLFKQKIAIVVSFGVLAMLIYFISLARYTNSLDDQLKKYSQKVAEHIETNMELADMRNENSLAYAVSDDYFEDTYDNILAKQKQDDYITTLCEEIKSLESNAQSVLVIMEDGNIYSSDDTFSSYIEQFKSIKNSELYKDTCLSNSFAVNKYNKYYNVECYSNSNAIFDKNGRRVGTIVITYKLDWILNEIASLNKEDFAGAVVYESFDKEVLAIVDENGIEKNTENEHIAEKANEKLSNARTSYRFADNNRKYNVSFVPNDSILLDRFNFITLVCTITVILTFFLIIILAYKRKEKYIVEVASITIVAITVFFALWMAYSHSFYSIELLVYKANLYNNKAWQQEYENSFIKGINALSDYAQSSLFKDVDNKLQARDFADLLADRTSRSEGKVYGNINRFFMYGKETLIYADENRIIDIKNHKITFSNKEQKERYNKIIKSDNNELSFYKYENENVVKTIYYKIRLLSKYNVVFSVEYNASGFYKNNAADRLNINELGETYFLNYFDGFQIALLRSNEIAKIGNMIDAKYVEVSDDIFDNHVKEFIESGKEVAGYNQISYNGRLTKMVLINNQDLKKVEIYFAKEEELIDCQRTMNGSILIEIGLFLTLLLYNLLEKRRIKNKEKKEEIILHGNY